jgi:hypothetical protein
MLSPCILSGATAVRDDSLSPKSAWSAQLVVSQGGAGSEIPCDRLQRASVESCGGERHKLAIGSGLGTACMSPSNHWQFCLTSSATGPMHKKCIGYVVRLQR